MPRSSRLATSLLTAGFLGAGLLHGCSAMGEQDLTPITVYATSTVSPWLEGVYACAPSNNGIVLLDGPDADVVLRLGEPQYLNTPAFQVGKDDVLVVAHPETGVGALTALQVEALFTGQYSNWRDVGGNDIPVQVWSYVATADIQAFFDDHVLHGRPVSSLARLAVSAQHMSDSVGAEPGSIGLLPRRWKAGNTREVLMVGTLPVLAVVPEEPQGAIAQLLSCMQAHQ